MRFRHRAIEVEAIQYSGTNKNEIVEFTSGQALTSEHTDAIRLSNPEGDMVARPGDYIVCDPSGCFHPVHPLVFEESYDLVKE